MPLLFTQTSTPRGRHRPDNWTSSPNSPQTSGTSAGRTMQSQTPFLEHPSTPYTSLKHHLLTLRRWLEHKPLIQSWGQSSSSSSLQLTTVPHLASSATLVCDTSTGTPRPFVPATFRPTVFDSLHSLSHLGAKATTQLITDRYVWPRMNTDIKAWTRCCIPCQRAKIHRHTLTPLSPFRFLTLASNRFISTLSAHCLKAAPVRSRTPRNVHVHKDLSRCTHVFVRIDRVRRPLESPYDGPYKVLERTDKFFTLDFRGHSLTRSPQASLSGDQSRRTRTELPTFLTHPINTSRTYPGHTLRQTGALSRTTHELRSLAHWGG